MVTVFSVSFTHILRLHSVTLQMRGKRALFSLCNSRKNSEKNESREKKMVFASVNKVKVELFSLLSHSVDFHLFACVPIQFLNFLLLLHFFLFYSVDFQVLCKNSFRFLSGLFLFSIVQNQRILQ